VAEEFAGGGVDDAHVEVGDEQDDGGSGVFVAEAPDGPGTPTTITPPGADRGWSRFPCLATCVSYVLSADTPFPTSLVTHAPSLNQLVLSFLVGNSPASNTDRNRPFSAPSY
jgi:hypothetical protein